jgi:Uma2 family endonuclease
MPVAVTELPVQMDPPKKRWTRTECEALSSSGLLKDQKFELVEGELISTMGKNRPHTNSLILLRFWLDDVFGRLRVNHETSIDVAALDNPINEPEPDLIVLKRDSTEYQRNPTPADIVLLVEVSDTAFYFDRSIKADLYARAGIGDYWVLDINGRRMIVHREPREGHYTSITAYSIDESVAPLAAPDSPFRVRDAFPTT